MPSVLKGLGQSKPAATTLTDIDTVPASKAHVVSSIFVCNQSISEDYFRISVAPAGAANTAAQYLYYDCPVPANETFTITAGITLAATDVLRVYSVNGNCSFKVFGSEEDA